MAADRSYRAGSWLIAEPDGTFLKTSPNALVGRLLPSNPSRAAELIAEPRGLMQIASPSFNLMELADNTAGKQRSDPTPLEVHSLISLAKFGFVLPIPGLST
jgi:hypothetical protein